MSVFVLHRLVPPRRDIKALWALTRQPTAARLDGLAVRYVRYVSPPALAPTRAGGRGRRPRSGGRFSATGRSTSSMPTTRFPAADAALRAGTSAPLVVSVHGGDVLWTSSRVRGGREAVDGALRGARLVLANSRGIESLAREHGAAHTRVVHLGADVPPPRAQPREGPPLIATVGHLVARKRHADVLEALAKLPGVRYLVIGDGPALAALQVRAGELGLADRVEFAGQLPPAQAALRASDAWCFVMPSTEEAFGVAYIEAMAAGIPAIGCAGEPGPAEIAAAGGGIELVPPRSPDALAECLRRLLGDEQARGELGKRARETVEREFTWHRCGERTLAAYEEALA